MEVASATGTQIYRSAEKAWNQHADAIDWKAALALVAGACFAIICVTVLTGVWECVFGCAVRTSCSPQCCISIHIAPPEHKLPVMRVAGRTMQRGRGQQVRATPAQWNAMRIALGPKVPDESVAKMLQKHVTDTHAACRDFYGPEYGGY